MSVELLVIVLAVVCLIASLYGCFTLAKGGLRAAAIAFMNSGIVIISDDCLDYDGEQFGEEAAASAMHAMKTLMLLDPSYVETLIDQKRDEFSLNDVD